MEVNSLGERSRGQRLAEWRRVEKDETEEHWRAKEPSLERA